MSIQAPRGSAGFGGALAGQGAHPLQEAAGHCHAALRQCQDRGDSLPELGRHLGWSPLPGAAQHTGGESRAGQGQPLAWHVPLQRSYIPIPQDLAPSFAPSFGQCPATLRGPGAVPAAVRSQAEAAASGL